MSNQKPFKFEEQLIFGRLTANPFILIRSTSFSILVGILQDDIHMIKRKFTRSTTSCSTHGRGGHQLAKLLWEGSLNFNVRPRQHLAWGKASHMYLAKYFFSFGFTIKWVSFILVKKKKKMHNKLKQNKNLF